MLRRSRNKSLVLVAERSMSFLVIGAALALWEMVAVLNANMRFVNPAFFPGAVKVGNEAWDMIQSGELLKHLVSSLSRVVAGFAIAAIAGVPLGTLAGRNRWVARVLDPI